MMWMSALNGQIWVAANEGLDVVACGHDTGDRNGVWSVCLHDLSRFERFVSAMKDLNGREMFLSADAEKVAIDLAALGAVFTSGHRDIRGQARAGCSSRNIRCLRDSPPREAIPRTFRGGTPPEQREIIGELDAIS